MGGDNIPMGWLSTIYMLPVPSLLHSPFRASRRTTTTDGTDINNDLHMMGKFNKALMSRTSTS